MTKTFADSPRASESRDARIGAVTALIVREPELAKVPGAGVVLAECALGFA